jgi:hypothetical protein
MVDKQSRTLHFGHLKVGNDFFMTNKLTFGELFARGRQQKWLHEELAQEIHDDGDDNTITGSEEEDN